MKKIFICLSLLILFATLLFSVDQYKDKQNIQITGLVRLVGGEPFTKITVQYDNIDFIIPDMEKKKFLPYLNHVVTIEGVLRIITLESADHKYKVKEFHLEKVKMIKK
jgi:hypothetical protein